MKNSIETLNEFIIKKRIREKYYYTDDDFKYLYEERLEQETPDGVAVFRQKDNAWVIYGDNGKQKIVGKGKDWKATDIKPAKMQWIGTNPITTGAKMLLNKAAEKSKDKRKQEAEFEKRKAERDKYWEKLEKSVALKDIRDIKRKKNIADKMFNKELLV